MARQKGEGKIEKRRREGREFSQSFRFRENKVGPSGRGRRGRARRGKVESPFPGKKKREEGKRRKPNAFPTREKGGD